MYAIRSYYDPWLDMNRHLDELLLRRGRLIERIASQREVLQHELVPVGHALGKVDTAVAAVHSAAATVRRHPVMASAAVAVLFWAKGKSLLVITSYSIHYTKLYD